MPGLVPLLSGSALAGRAQGPASTGFRGVRRDRGPDRHPRPGPQTVMPAPHIVMPGLVPGISLHRFSRDGRMDARNKSGHDGRGRPARRSLSAIRRPLLHICNKSRKSAFGGLRARRGTGRMALPSNPGRRLPEGIRNEESTSERRPHKGHYGKLLRLSKGGAAPLQHQRRPGRPQRKEGRGYGP